MDKTLGATSSYEVFLGYHSADPEAVAGVKSVLQARGISAFLDRDDLPIGIPWPESLERGDLSRAEEILEEAAMSFAAITEIDQQSRAWAAAARVHIRLGDYERAMAADKLTIAPDDRVEILAGVIRDHATRSNPKLDASFDKTPFDGIGRFDTHWP